MTLEPSLASVLGPVRPDLVLTAAGLIGVVEFKDLSSSPISTLSVTRRNPEGFWDFVAILHQPCSPSIQVAASQLRDLWPLLVPVFSSLSGVLSLKSVQYAYTQEEITRVASAHLSVSMSLSGGAERDASVVEETAAMWRLLNQLGSFKPAEVISEVTGVKPRTINARLKAAREKGLIPPVKRGGFEVEATDHLRGR